MHIMDKENRRVCKHCLLQEINKEEYLEKIHKYVVALDKDVRADEALYQERLSKCNGCKYLVDGTCNACGCYVELRAAVKKSKCPYKFW